MLDATEQYRLLGLVFFLPDMAPIEHVLDELGRWGRARTPPPAIVPQLHRTILEEWYNIPQHRLALVVLSMRRRCTACHEANGLYTRYWLLWTHCFYQVFYQFVIVVAYVNCYLLKWKSYRWCLWHRLCFLPNFITYFIIYSVLLLVRFHSCYITNLV